MVRDVVVKFVVFCGLWAAAIYGLIHIVDKLVAKQ